jgi:hypothetical protein
MSAPRYINNRRNNADADDADGNDALNDTDDYMEEVD